MKYKVKVRPSSMWEGVLYLHLMCKGGWFDVWHSPSFLPLSDHCVRAPEGATEDVLRDMACEMIAAAKEKRKKGANLHRTFTEKDCG